MKSSIQKLIQYKNWANDLTFKSAFELPEAELTKPRKTNFGNILHTLNHVFVVDDIFRHHLLGQAHDYTSRNTETSPALAELWRRQQEMDTWYVDHIDGLSEEALSDVIQFTFVGGGAGAMTREEIFLHIVNHATYHRGFVSDMMYQIPARLQANDFPVFLRDRTV